MSRSKGVRHCVTAVLPLAGVGKKCGVEGCGKMSTHEIEIIMVSELITIHVPMCNDCARILWREQPFLTSHARLHC